MPPSSRHSPGGDSIPQTLCPPRTCGRDFAGSGVFADVIKLGRSSNSNEWRPYKEMTHREGHGMTE